MCAHEGIVTESTIEFDTGAIVLRGSCWSVDQSSRAPVLFLHGGGQTRHSWKGSADRVASAGRTVFALDARGHGDSDWDPDGDYSMEAFTGDLTAFLESVGRPTVLVGASLGGITALKVAGDRPDLVAALALVDVVVDLEEAGVKRIQNFMLGNADGFSSLKEVADAIAAYNPNRPRPRNLEGLKKNVRRGEDGRWHWHWDPAFMRIGDEPRRHVETKLLQVAARRVLAPTIIVRGRQSDVVSEAGVSKMRKLLPHVKIATIGTAGHMVAGDDNAVFGDALDGFLSEVP